MAVEIKPDNDPEDLDAIDFLNVPHDASEDEVQELEKDLGTTEKKEVVAEPEGEESEEDEETSSAKMSEEESEAGTEAEKAAIREKKKTDRLNQRQRARARIESLERQLANALAANQAIQQRVGNLENSNLGTQAAELNRAAAEIEQAEAAWNAVIADAVIKQDGAKVADGVRAMAEIRARKDMIATAKSNLEAQSKAPRAQPLDTEVVNNAKAFMTENPWFKPRSSDLDSKVLSNIDNALTAEGWDPRSPSYWNELKARASKYLPHRFKAGGEGEASAHEPGYTTAPAERRAPKSPVAGSGTSSSNGGGKANTYTLTPDRVRAMKEAGFWDDPERRASMTKRYQQADREAAASRKQ